MIIRRLASRVHRPISGVVYNMKCTQRLSDLYIETSIKAVSDSAGHQATMKEQILL